ncbi:MAG TPA: NADAR family protein [Pyrinomonadaceae bacterium]|jgi:hypothetical protein
MAIRFYSKNEAFSEFSNFSPHGIEMDELWYPTIEHYFQAQKFHDVEYREKIRLARTAKDSKTLGRSRKIPIRSDWEEVKDEIMFEACLKKFQTHKSLKELLLSTGDEELIENAPMDYYWGCGRTGTGQNKLGKILMRVREQLRKG